MKHVITRLSPVQNAKVFGVLLALVSFVITILFSIAGLIFMWDSVGASHWSEFVVPLLLLPVIYLLVGFITAIVGCSLYNLIVRWLGGFEYEAE